MDPSLSDKTMNEVKEKPLSKHLPKILFGIAILGVFCYVFAIYFYYTYFDGDIIADHDKWGQFGDYLGGTLNPLFAFLALIALLLTVVLQNRELKLSTKELSESSKALKEQSLALNLQNFENTFFHMVTLHNEIVSGIDLRGVNSEITSQGRDCFRYFFKQFASTYSMVLRSEDNNNIDMLNIVRVAYSKFFEKRQSDLGHYFRNLYRIIKFVDESRVVNKNNYVGIIRAQLSSYELSLLFYNSLQEDYHKFKKLIESYALFENMDLKLLTNRLEQVKLYDRSAYGDQDV